MGHHKLNEKSFVPAKFKRIYSGKYWSMYCLPSDYVTGTNTPEEGEVVASPLFLLTNPLNLPLESTAMEKEKLGFVFHLVYSWIEKKNHPKNPVNGKINQWFPVMPEDEKEDIKTRVPFIMS